MGTRRANGEGSIFPYRNGYAAYVWVTTPAGERKRKWVYGKTRDEAHEKHTDLLRQAANGPMQTTTPTVEQYLTYWLGQLGPESGYARGTVMIYESSVHRHIIPGLGRKRLDRLTVSDVRRWINGIEKRYGDRAARDAWTALVAALGLPETATYNL